MATIKTHPTGEDVTAFLDSVPAERRRAEEAGLAGFHRGGPQVRPLGIGLRQVELAPAPSGS